MNQKITVTINREYGSNGRAIGAKLSESLGIHYYDKEILKLASDVSGISEALFNNADEQSQIRKTPLFRLSKESYGGELIPPDSSDFTSDRNLFNYQAEVIRQLYERESSVIVGRCGGFVLRDKPNVVHVFIHAPFAYLVKQAEKKKSLPARELPKFVEKVNRRRAEYTEFFTGRRWDDVRNYDLSIDASKYSMDACVEIIKGYMKVRFPGLEF